MKELKHLVTRVRQSMAPRVALVSAFCMTAVLTAHAQADPFTNNATSWQSTFCGPLAKTIVVIGTVVAGAPMALNKPGDHKGALLGVGVGGTLMLAAQTVVTTFFQ